MTSAPAQRRTLLGWLKRIRKKNRVAALELDWTVK